MYCLAKAVPSLAVSRMFGYFGNLVGGKSLDRADLEPVLKGVRETLIEKNVAVRPQGNRRAHQPASVTALSP